ncbi:hypothetical protein POJ06DRAFT_259389 [Lipomyces tetrasporus]|uniref:Uncharacterized protein n=1 Tax=Lipomyces tetrasporus TaxID=54092 RepID=A0AAD7VQR3_9ASCO|nr:uncharacterized protein POJ06DRAFT_259389 [Lipomyces tetrasporus]KAJ8098408.1 hypothetical protein POJ06DRAFT_259389 [Lipomyces tetrasporus]
MALSNQVSPRMPVGSVLALYTHYIHTHPLLFKAITVAFISGSSEIISSYIAEFLSRRARKSSSLTPPRWTKFPFSKDRVAKLSAYGFFVAGPLLHYILALVARLAPATSRYRKLRLYFAALLLTPLLDVAHIITMSVVAGARKPQQVGATLQRGMLPAINVTAPWFPAIIVIASSLGIGVDWWTVLCASMAGGIGVVGGVVSKSRR